MTIMKFSVLALVLVTGCHAQEHKKTEAHLSLTGNTTTVTSRAKIIDVLGSECRNGKPDYKKFIPSVANKDDQEYYLASGAHLLKCYKDNKVVIDTEEETKRIKEATDKENHRKDVLKKAYLRVLSDNELDELYAEKESIFLPFSIPTFDSKDRQCFQSIDEDGVVLMPCTKFYTSVNSGGGYFYYNSENWSREFLALLEHQFKLRRIAHTPATELDTYVEPK